MSEESVGIIGNRGWVYALVFLICLRIVMVIGIMHGFPPIQGPGAGWYVHISSYDAEFFNLAKSLAEFRPILTHLSLGLPLFLAPFIWMFRPGVIDDILLPIAVFNSVFLFGVSVIFIAGITKMINNEDKKAGLFSAGLWVFLPYLAYLAVLFNPRLGCLDVPQKRAFYLMWTALSDEPLFTSLILSGVYIFVRFLKHRKKISYPVLMGVSFGFASLVNPLTCAAIGISFILTFLFIRCVRAFIYSAGAFGMFSIPQLIYNWRFNGSPFYFLAISPERHKVYNDMAIPWFSLNNLVFSISRIRGRVGIGGLSVLIVLAVVMLIAAFYILKKKDKSRILLIWALPYFFFIIFYSGFSFSVLECLFPILPAAIIMFSIMLADIATFVIARSHATEGGGTTKQTPSSEIASSCRSFGTPRKDA